MKRNHGRLTVRGGEANTQYARSTMYDAKLVQLGNSSWQASAGPVVALGDTQAEAMDNLSEKLRGV